MQWESALEQTACSRRGQLACEVCQRGRESQEGLRRSCPMLTEGPSSGAAPVILMTSELLAETCLQML